LASPLVTCGPAHPVPLLAVAATLLACSSSQATSSSPAACDALAAECRAHLARLRPFAAPATAAWGSAHAFDLDGVDTAALSCVTYESLLVDDVLSSLLVPLPDGTVDVTPTPMDLTGLARDDAAGGQHGTVSLFGDARTGPPRAGAGAKRPAEDRLHHAAPKRPPDWATRGAVGHPAFRTPQGDTKASDWVRSGGSAPGKPEVLEVDESDGEGGAEVVRTARAAMFKTAAAQLREDAKRNPNATGRPVSDMGAAGRGGHQSSAPGGYGGLPNPGRGAGGRRLGMGSTGASVRGGFVPPFIRKGLNDATGQPGRGVQAQAGQAGSTEGPLSARSLEMLRVSDPSELPDALAKLDPETLETVCNEVVEEGASMTWDDIAGQDSAKRLIQEMVVWPMLNPHLFTGARAPPRGVLLFGPPGTGKTLLGKAIATNISATFFNISASSLTSKWIGQSEKLVRALFAVAGHLQPSVIFIDEIDSLLSARKSEGEHEASRRLKTEMLVQMEGIDPNSSERQVLIIGATNRPEELDEAARRRMPKQLYVPLPCEAARRAMVKRQLGPGRGVASALTDEDFEKVVKKTQGYSGSDMRNLIQEACQGPVRDAVAMHGSRVAELREEDLRPVVLRDFQMAARAQKASVAPEEVLRYVEYDQKHGARYVEGDGADVEGEEEDW